MDAENIRVQHQPGNAKQLRFYKPERVELFISPTMAFVETNPRPADQAWESVPKSLKLEK